jgi:hypothetical protein
MSKMVRDNRPLHAALTHSIAVAGREPLLLQPANQRAKGQPLQATSATETAARQVAHAQAQPRGTA